MIFDLSFKQINCFEYKKKLKAVAVNDNLEIRHEACVQFDYDLPEFRYYFMISCILPINQ
jgi:hypothetical protein